MTKLELPDLPRRMTCLEFLRRCHSWSQGQLGQAAQIDQKLISWIELGRLVPTDDELTRLGRALEISPDKLLKPVVPADDEAQSCEAAR